jgi:putative GTP pyrophosphokinase
MWRLKDPDHLAVKLRRKFLDGEHLRFPPTDLGRHVTDLAGVRVMHLHQDQFAKIHPLVMRKVQTGDWFLFEQPKAYTWDPESKAFFQDLGLECELKASSYTSVHYVVRPRADSLLACEIQVRTLFEEIWGEVDHSLNYPDDTPIISCREQLKVLAKLVGAGSRLVESIFKTQA